MTTMTNRAVRLCELTSSDYIVRDMKFDNCQIVGPSVVAPLGRTSLKNCTFDGTPDSLLWEVPESRTAIIGAVGLEDCQFVNCGFTGIGFAGPRSLIERLLAGT